MRSQLRLIGALVAVLLVPVTAASAGTDTLPGPGGKGPAFPFEACGVLQFGNDGNDCWVFITHNGSIYTIENIGPFGDGDAVCVSGEVVYHQCFTVCGEVTGCIFNNTITDEFEGFGTYAQGFECGVLVTETGASYQINGPLPDGIETGDPIHVSGALDAECLSFCDLICIQDAVVLEVFEGPGTLGPGPQGCPGFSADSGEFFVLENTGNFLPGQRVYVTGANNPESLLCLPVVFPAIEDNEIYRFFEGCGEVGPGPQSCLNFTADSGEGFFLLGDPGPIDLFERFYIEGFVVPDSIACFPIIGTALVATAGEPCSPADVNGDGAVNVEDLVALITAWGPCAGCPEDVNGDGVVNVEDLVALIVAWDP